MGRHYNEQHILGGYFSLSFLNFIHRMINQIDKKKIICWTIDNEKNPTSTGLSNKWCISNNKRSCFSTISEKMINTDLLFDVFKWWGWDNWETYKEYVCLWIAEWTQPVVILLTWEQRSQEKCFSFWFRLTPFRYIKRDLQRHWCYLLCQIGQVYRALPQSSLSLHSCQKPLKKKDK